MTLVTVVIAIAAVLLSWFMQNVIHEASHMFVAIAKGYVPLEFRPYPVFRHGRWFFAYCRYDARGETPPRIIHIAPFIGGMIHNHLRKKRIFCTVSL